MHEVLSSIPGRILSFAEGALTQANHHAVFCDPDNEHWGYMSVVNTAHAGELFMKAIIAKAHPLLVFKDLFSLDQGSTELGLEELVRHGRTHDFEKLPKILYAVTGERIPNQKTFTTLRNTRNAIQHFCAPEEENFRRISLEFIYNIIDPLIRKHFNLFAIEYHEDHGIGYDYLVGCIIRNELRFSVPDDFNVGEIDLSDELQDVSPDYLTWFKGELDRLGKINLLK